MYHRQCYIYLADTANNTKVNLNIIITLAGQFICITSPQMNYVLIPADSLVNGKWPQCFCIVCKQTTTTIYVRIITRGLTSTHRELFQMMNERWCLMSVGWGGGGQESIIY